MQNIVIYGSSDDLIEVEGKIEGCDEYNPSPKEPVGGKITVTAQKEVVTIYCLYDGCWSFAVSPWPNEEKLPWAIDRVWGSRCPYSETLVIIVPNNARVQFEKL